MNWVTVVWSMGASACLTLAMIYFLVWLKAPATRAHLMFAVTATSTALFAYYELRMLTSLTPQELDAALRWCQLPLSAAILSLIWFVSMYLQAGRRWLAWTVCGLRVLFVLPNLVLGGNTTLLEIPEIERIELFGQYLTINHGTPNPWGTLGSLTVFLSIGFIVDASVTAWRRGDRRKALVIGGGAAFFLACGVTISTLIVFASFRVPPAISLYYQMLVAVMAYELSRDVLRASQLASELRASEARSAALVRAIPDLMFLQTTDGVYVDYHAPHPSLLFLPPEQFLGRNMRDVLPELVFRGIDPAFQQAARSAEPVVMEYELPVPLGNRLYEARLVRNENNQILTLVRDVTEGKRAEAALRESEAVLQASHHQIQELAGRLIESQEVERARIARDLHDDLSQQVAGFSIALSSLKRRVGVLPGAADLPSELSGLQQRAVALADNIRNLSHDLHPSVLAHAGLVVALSTHCAEFERQQPIVISFTAEGEFESTGTAAALCLYRVAQEALRNVVMHAAAAHAEVRLLRVGDLVELTIADDGAGFEIDPVRRHGHGLGLVSINERVRLAGGTVSLVTELNKGTRLRVQIPVNEASLSPAAR